MRFKVRTKGANPLKCLTDPDTRNRQWGRRERNYICFPRANINGGAMLSVCYLEHGMRSILGKHLTA